jgi:hypothetical protein
MKYSALVDVGAWTDCVHVSHLIYLDDGYLQDCPVASNTQPWPSGHVSAHRFDIGMAGNFIECGYFS